MADAGATSVGIIGVGRMGAAMARRLAPHHEVLGYDVCPRPDVGIEMVASPALLAERCDLLLLVLPSPRETRAVVTDPSFRSAFQAGHTVAFDMSTSDPASLESLASELGEAGERLLDAPVLGRPERCGAWTIPVGGDEVALERARLVLERLAARVEHLGPRGSAHTLKLLNNLMFAAINAVSAEVIGACEALGLPAQTFVDVVANSQAATVSPLFRDLAPRMVDGDDQTVFTVDLLAKDLQLAVRMCEDAGASLVSSRASQIVVAQALRLGLGPSDSAALVRCFRATEKEVGVTS